MQSTDVGGGKEKESSANFWERRRLFPAPDLTSDNEPIRRKNWVKIKWEGDKESLSPRRFIVRSVLLYGMGFSPSDLSEVTSQSEMEFDITVKLPEALNHFWRLYNIQKRAGHQSWEKLVVISMTKPEKKKYYCCDEK